MDHSQKHLYRLFGLLSFVAAFVVYSLTVQDTVAFWDCPEFSTGAIHQQVPHPPGAPLFLMAGKVFDTVLWFGDPGWRVNMLSVTASAIVILLLYLITVSALRNISRDALKTKHDFLSIYGAAFIGAMAFAFSDTFWYNAVESEVYASSTLFLALITWLMMRWNEEADNTGHERYLLLIFYLIGLSTGVHLLAVLTIFSVVLVVYFRRHNYSHKGLILTFVLACGMFLLVYPGIVQKVPNLLLESIPLVFAIVLGVVGILAWAKKRNKAMVAMACSSALLLLGGYTTYTQILLRSQASPPMNENKPDDLESLLYYVNREQYEAAPKFFPRRFQSEPRFTNIYKQYGPLNELKRDNESLRNIGSLSSWSKVHYDADLAYMWDYQMNHMYWRYFAWNFFGKTGDLQGSPSASWFTDDKDVEFWNWNSGFADVFPIQLFAFPFIVGMLGLLFHFKRDPKMAFAFLVLFLMTGLFTALFQNQQNPQPRERDYFYTGSFMVFAMWIGIGAHALIGYLNRRRLPFATAGGLLGVFVLVPVLMATEGWSSHDRTGNYMPTDYAYNILQSTEQDAIVFSNGDNDTFSVWYAQDVIGVRRDVRLVNLTLSNGSWYVEQLKNLAPWGAKRIPLSFTDEMLEKPQGEPGSLLGYSVRGEAPIISIPVAQETLREFTDDESIVQGGQFQWRWEGKPIGNGKQNGYFMRVQDILIRDILEQTRFERPVYFSATVGPDAFCGLEPYFRLEGMCYRVCPVVQSDPSRGIRAANERVMDASIFGMLAEDENYKDQHFGFRIRNLNNPDVYLDETYRNPAVHNYRQVFLDYATYLVVNGKNEKALKVLNLMNDTISLDLYPMPYYALIQPATLFDHLGDSDSCQDLARRAVEVSEKLIADEGLRVRERATQYYSYQPHFIASEAYALLGEKEQAIHALERYLNDTGNPNDPAVHRRIEQLRAL